MLSDKEAAEKLRELESETHDDIESRHLAADRFLLRLLKELGYTETVAVFEDMHLWYA